MELGQKEASIEAPVSDLAETVLANATLVLSNEVIRGAVTIRGGCIAAIDQGVSVPSGAVDCAGEYLAPGLIELHTDNLERHMTPRPGVKWPLDAAVLAHDAELFRCQAGLPLGFGLGWFFAHVALSLVG